MSKKDKLSTEKKYFRINSFFVKKNKLHLQKIRKLDYIFMWQSISNTLPNCIYIKDTQGKYLWVNQNSIKQIKKLHAIHIDIVGKKDSDVFPKATAENYDQIVLQTIRLFYKTKKGVFMKKGFFYQMEKK